MRTVLIVMLLMATAGVVRFPNDAKSHVSLALEVGYPMLSPRARKEVWGLYRYSGKYPSGLQVDETVIGTVVCKSNICEVARVDRRRVISNGMWVPARVIQEGPESLLLLLKPFPISAGYDGASEAVRFQKGHTKLITATYRRTGSGELRFLTWALSGVSDVPAPTWK
jgi:hypothetical protein